MEMFNNITAKFKKDEPIQAQELINEDEEENYLKSTSANRSPTDVVFLIIHGVLLVLLVFVIGYTVINGDIERLTKGYDDCGNVCGKNNNFDIVYQMNCKAKDMSQKPFLQIKDNHRECVDHCDNLDGYHCLNNIELQEDKEIEEFLQGFLKCLHRSTNEIIGLSAIALGFAFIVLLLLRYATAVFIWFTLFGITLICIGSAVFFGNAASGAPTEEEMATSVRATIFYGILGIAMLIIIFGLRKYIELLIQLFKEAGKSIITMPILLFEPILTFISLGLIWSAWFYFALWIESAGTVEEVYGKVIFVKTVFLCIAELFHIFMMLWMVQFVCGCQNMLVAGAVSTWYFTRNKCNLDKPIYNSAKNMIKYHLGTISVTSLIIAIIQFVKILVLMLRRTLRFATCITYCLDYVERWMRYYTKNSCIVTAIHGYHFRAAGSRAFKLIVENIVQIITINSVGDWVLILAKLLVAASTLGICHLMIKDKPGMDYEWAILILVGIMAYMIAHCFFSVYEASIDTIFICFCEDREMNDGITRPYFMSAELMAFIEKSKTIVKIKQNTTSNVRAA